MNKLNNYLLILNLYSYTDNGFNSYKCICEEGWKGLNCSEDVNECLNNPITTNTTTNNNGPCENNGNCTNNNGSFNCQCQDEWKGKTCNVPRKSGEF